MSRPPVRASALTTLLLLLALVPACLIPARLPAPTGQLEKDRFVHAAYRVSWPNPGGWKALWPREGDGFDFGWSRGADRALLWLLPDSGDLAGAGRSLAMDHGWEFRHTRKISWQGYPAWDAQICEPGLLGRLRVARTQQGIVAVAVLSPQVDQGREAAALAGVMESLRLMPPGDVLHVVRYPNESLSIIAKWYTESAAAWPKIQEYNGLKSDRLDLGQVILIPAELAVRLAPLPAWAVPPLPGESEPKKDRPAQTGGEPGSGIQLMPIGPK